MRNRLSFLSSLYSKLRLFLKSLGLLIKVAIKTFTKTFSYCLNITKNILNILFKEVRLISAVLLTLFFITVIFLAFFPATQRIEGTLIVKRFDFTSKSAGRSADSLFLKDIRQIREIGVSGAQNLTISGKFSSKKHPKLNEINKLEIELPRKDSYWKIIAVDKKNSDLTLESLHIPNNTKVHNLTYKSYQRKIAFDIETQNKSSSLSNLRITPGNGKVYFVVGNYRLPKAPRTLLNVQDPNIPLEFSLQTAQFEIPITGSLIVDIELPDNLDEEWLPGNLNVSHVEFKSTIRGGDALNDVSLDSSILEGKVRMAGREMEVESNQFLNFADPGINKLQRIKIVDPQKNQDLELKVSGKSIKISEPSRGLEVKFLGEASSVWAGLDQNWPITKLQGNFLSRYFPNDTIIALVSFSSAMIVSLISWLIDYSRRLKSNP